MFCVPCALFTPTRPSQSAIVHPFLFCRGLEHLHPRAPCGAQPKQICDAIRDSIFTLTRPSRSASSVTHYTQQFFTIYTHAPRVWRNACSIRNRSFWSIYTHAPRVWRNSLKQLRQSRTATFIPTRSVWNATQLYVYGYIHAPYKRAQHGKPSRCRGEADLHPRAPRENATWDSSPVYTHAPRVGRNCILP